MDEDMVPHEGMKFQSIDDAYLFYNMYAKTKGFGTRRAKAYPNFKYFFCSKEGSKRLDDPRESDKEVNRRHEVRDNCNARMIIKKGEEGEWIVSKFIDTHSHEMATPSKVGKIRSHRKLTEVSKQLIAGLSECGVGPSKISRVLNHGADVEYTSQDCRNEMYKSQANNMGGEFLKVYQYFQDKIGVEDGFFFKMQVDENMQVRSVFWADARARDACKIFGDVLVFDVTYNTNKFKMPFAPFTGINHHRQSTLFGCALLADETKETFVWLFEKWLECMGGKAPTSIITDQDGQIRDAIAEVFPNTQHRFCSWHIGKNALVHLKQFQCLEGFDHDYKSWTHASTPEQCDQEWDKMKAKYAITDGSWLEQMHSVRHNWINAYLRMSFFAGMTSSQRSESMNSFFDGYVNAQTTISAFVVQYEKALASRRQQESAEDFKSMNSKASMFLGDLLEQHARSIYTRKMFDVFKEQYKRAMLYSCEGVEEDGSIVYKIAKKSTPAKYQLVSFERHPTICLKCSCMKFEGEGVLCRHILRLMFQLNMTSIPEHYILFRWTIMARYGASSTLQCVNASTSNVTPSMVFALQSASNKIVTSGTKTMAHWNLVMPAFSTIIDDLDRLTLREESVQYENSVVADDGADSQADSVMFLDPSRKVTKGRPKICARYKSGVEMSQSSQKKLKAASMKPIQRRRCGKCGVEGHYSTTCTANLADRCGERSRAMHLLNEGSESGEEEDMDVEDLDE